MLAMRRKPSPAFLEHGYGHGQKADSTHEFSDDFESQENRLGFEIILFVLSPNANEYVGGFLMSMAAL